jgi:hypothetical protein
MFFATIFTILSFLASALNHACFVEDLLSKTSAVRCGAERLVGMTKQRFMDRLTWLKCLLRFNLSNWYDRKTFERVSQTLEMLKLDNSNGSIRKQPYCVLLTGYPGCGKSSYALQIATACLRSRYGIAHPSDIVTLNETDEFQSEFRSSHKVVVFDDLGAEKVRPNTINPWRKVIDFVNNIRKTSLNPNVEMKGHVYIEPDLVVITTNLDNGFQIADFMNAPGAIYRRLKQIIFLEDGYTNAKLYTKSVGSNSLNERVCDHVTVCKKNTDTMERKELIDVIVRDFNRHLDAQEKFINDTNQHFDKVENKSILASFYSDVVLPFLPRKVALPQHLEKQLPFYDRWFRFFCVIDPAMPVCMSSSSLEYSLDETDGTLIDPPEIRPVETTNCRQVHLEPQSGFVEEDDIHYYLLYFLVTNVNWDFYRLVRKNIAHEEDLMIFEDRIVGRYDCYSWKYPQHTANNYEAVGVSCTAQDMEQAYKRYKELYFEKTNSDHENDSEASKKEMISSYIRQHLTIDGWIRRYASDLTRVPDANVIKTIETCPDQFDLVGYEVKIKGGIVDLIFRYIGAKRKYYCIVEVKKKASLISARNQATKYKQFLDKTRPAATHLFIATFNDEGMYHTPLQGGKKHLNDISNLNKFLSIWKKNYLDRCGAVEHSSEVETPEFEQEEADVTSDIDLFEFEL